MTDASDKKDIVPQQIAQGISVSDRGIQITNVDDMFRVADAIHQSGLAPKGFESVQQVLVTIQMGLELGLPPMAALRTICVINGRPSIWGDGMLGVVRASGLLLSIEELIEGEGDKMVAVCRTSRMGDESTVERRFSVADAKTAGLWAQKDPWKKYPKRMLQMRARGFCLRDHFADILSGMGTAEEALDHREVFDTDRVKGDKAENLARKLTGAESEVVAESDATEVAEQTDPQPTEQGESAGHPTSKAPAASTPPDGQQESTDATETKQPAGDTPTAAKPERFASLVSDVATVAGIEMGAAEPYVEAWLAENGWTKLSVKNDAVWREIWNTAQAEDWAARVGKTEPAAA